MLKRPSNESLRESFRAVIMLQTLTFDAALNLACGTLKRFIRIW